MKTRLGAYFSSWTNFLRLKTRDQNVIETNPKSFYQFLCQQIPREGDASKLCWTRCSCQEAEKVPSQLLPQAGDP